MKKFKRNEDAFTGLEAAIVLIAFVVVAAVFSYVVLGAGFFTTQKSQEVVHSGVTQAASNIVVKGEVYGINATDNPASIEYIQFDVGLAAGGLPVDMNRTTLTFSTVNVAPYVLTNDYASFNQETAPAAGTWKIWNISAGSTDDMTLQTAETFTIRVRPSADIVPREQFLIAIKPETGAALGIERTVPPAITKTTLLY